MPLPTTAYYRIRPKLDTGDLVLFSGRGFGAICIHAGQLPTHCPESAKWTHVGMVYRPTDAVLLWESTTLTNIADLDTGEPRKGVQLVGLSGRVSTYVGDVAIRRLKIQRTAKMRSDMDDLRQQLKGRPYERSRVDLVMSVIPNGGKEDLSSLFCSELLAESWQAWDLLPNWTPSDRWCPADFAAITTLERGSLGPVEYVKRWPVRPRPKKRSKVNRPRR